jgi:hypothetical protein
MLIDEIGSGNVMKWADDLKSHALRAASDKAKPVEEKPSHNQSASEVSRQAGNRLTKSVLVETMSTIIALSGLGYILRSCVEPDRVVTRPTDVRCSDPSRRSMVCPNRRCGARCL